MSLQDPGFTGREYDSETGLYYYRARHYDPAPGRFLQSDPLGFAGGDLNLYAYTWNDPSNWTDPSGLSPEGDVTYEAALAMMYEHRAVAVVGTGAVCAANRVSTALYDMGNLLAEGRPVYEAELEPAASCATQAVATAVVGRLMRPARATCGRGGKNSFPAGTSVLTPDGPVAIESLREGDLVVARDEDTGESGVFPVTGLAVRQATDMLWLTLERGDGTTTRMGVTTAHPLFVVGDGWAFAEELAPGDAIRDRHLAELRVLAVEFDDTPQLAYNLEIAEAHTYFAGELEAWGHNTKINPPRPPSPSRLTVNGVSFTSNYPNDHGPTHLHVSGGGPTTKVRPNGKAFPGFPEPTAKQVRACQDPGVRKLFRNAYKWVRYYKRIERAKGR